MLMTITMRTLFPCVCLFLIFVPASAATPAELSAREAISKFNRGDHDLIIYVTGLANAYGWVNAQSENTKLKMLFCPPEKLAITVSQNMDILKRFVAAHPHYADSSLGLALLDALKDALPCSD
jgi:hypothetical protein